RGYVFNLIFIIFNILLALSFLSSRSFLFMLLTVHINKFNNIFPFIGAFILHCLFKNVFFVTNHNWFDYYPHETYRLFLCCFSSLSFLSLNTVSLYSFAAFKFSSCFFLLSFSFSSNIFFLLISFFL